MGFKAKILKGDIIFNTNSIKEFIKLSDNGDFYVRGKLCTNDMELYLGMREWFNIYAKQDLENKD